VFKKLMWLVIVRLVLRKNPAVDIRVVRPMIVIRELVLGERLAVAQYSAAME
jgi:hypothetical protein